jgi:deoxyribonuclease-4
MELQIMDQIDIDPCCCATNITKSRILVDCGKLHRVGGHVSLEATLLQTVSKPQNTIQCYLGSKITYNVRKLQPQDKDAVRKYCEQHNKTFHIHAPYVAYLARDAKTMKEQEMLSKSIRVVQDILNEIKGLPGTCVLHMGKVGTVPLLAQRVNELQLERGLYSSCSRQLLMEVGAGQKNEIGVNWNEVRQFFELMDSNKVGICLDTQHMFASGMCTFDSHESVVKMYDYLEASTGMKVPSLIHLNDSVCECGGHVDRHAPLSSGHIWGHGKNVESLDAIMQRTKEDCSDIILETCAIREDLEFLRSKYHC